jgi:TonB family protein
MRTLRHAAAAALVAATLLAGRSVASGHAEAGAPAPAMAPLVLSRVPVDVPEAALEAKLQGTVTLRVRVSAVGLVDSVRVVSGDPRLREDAAACARWWLFAPPARPVWTTVAIDVDGREDVDPLSPDVLAMATDAERRGAPWEALDACVGGLQRIGTHPRLRNPWALRERAIRLSRLMPERLHVPGALMSPCQNARGQQLRSMASLAHESYVATFDQALLASPWWADGYQWCAASLLLCGRGYDAVRTLVLFRDAAKDSAARGLADRALAGLAAGDTLAVSRLLMHEGVQFNRDEDADH